MEFVTFGDQRFPVVGNGEKIFAMLPDGSMPRITAYDYWRDKPRTFVFYRRGVACYGKLRVKAGGRQTSLWATAEAEYLNDIRYGMWTGAEVIGPNGLYYRVGAINQLRSRKGVHGDLRVRLDPIDAKERRAAP